jgi:hypothetical protein
MKDNKKVIQTLKVIEHELNFELKQQESKGSDSACLDGVIIGLKFAIKIVNTHLKHWR